MLGATEKYTEGLTERQDTFLKSSAKDFQNQAF